MRSLLLAPAALAALLLLTSCATPPADAEPSPVPSSPSAEPTPTPSSPSGVLGCDDLLGSDLVSAALAGEDGESPEPVAARQPSADLGDLAVDMAGGLTCSWRIGAAEGNPLEYRDADDWAYLHVRVLPEAAGDWTAYLFGDSPVDGRATIAGVEAATGCGDFGCAISAPVGDAWVELSVSAFNFALGASPYGSMSIDEIVADLTPAAESVFAATAGAGPDQLAWPDTMVADVTAQCNGALDPQGVGAALGLSSFSYDEPEITLPPVAPLSVVAAYRAKVYSCYGSDGDTVITVARGGDDALRAALAEPDLSTGLEPLTLELAVDGEVAARACADTSSYCSVLFTIGDTAYQVESRVDAVAVAEAMIAQAR
ncbi:hypothetical protein [Naasia aerilata]|uniref:DUF3558 domain-containing protein n=1 Tax=Naasia aerilata TaxID=1162966 RepID=A0ABM8GE13_9MICO|nr:hypothetical protein [Naasia aerilata]BDZ46508.1 hypothetical protein GCM10025866_24170 [Naasia aerilata]